MCCHCSSRRLHFKMLCLWNACSIICLLNICILIANAATVLETHIGENITYLCDEVLLKDVAHQIEVLRLNVELNNVNLEKQLVTQTTTLLKDITKLLQEHNEQSQQPPDIDIRFGGVDTQPECMEKNVSSKLYPTNCDEALHMGSGESGVYMLFLPESSLAPFYVYCLRDPDNGAAWTIIQRRQDGSIDFYRNWDDYKIGFGNLEGEYFIGLQQIYAITQTQLQELWIQLEDFAGETRSAKYETFAIGNEYSKYALNVLGTYHGNAGDDLRAHQGQKFTTKDSDNDSWKANCAVEFTGGWWYNKCHSSNLNGQYLRGEYEKNLYAKGVTWSDWHGQYYSMKYAHMALRPARK